MGSNNCWTVSKWKSALWSESKFDILVGNHGRRVLRAKEGGRPSSVLLAFSSKVSISDGMGVHTVWAVCMFWKPLWMLKFIKVLEQHMLPSRWRVFQLDNEKPHTASITTAWLHSRRIRVLNLPACSPDLSPIENIWPIIKWKICQSRPQTLQQRETYIRLEWGQIPTPKLQKLTTLMPRRLQTVLKMKRRCYTMVNMPPSQIFWDM